MPCNYHDAKHRLLQQFVWICRRSRQLHTACAQRGTISRLSSSKPNYSMQQASIFRRLSQSRASMRIYETPKQR